MKIDDRMKAYEEATRFKLGIRQPVIIRLDGVAFHTLTKEAQCLKPYDADFAKAMTDTANYLIQNTPARMAYTQSDEISLLFIDYNKFDSQQWYGGVIQKMASVAASMASTQFNDECCYYAGGGVGHFDARVFPVPERDIENYFIWRQKDCMRNAISGAAQAKFPHKELQNKSTKDMLEMIGNDINNYPVSFRQGTVVDRVGQMAAPIFTANKEFLARYLKIEEE